MRYRRTITLVSLALAQSVASLLAISALDGNSSAASSAASATAPALGAAPPAEQSESLVTLFQFTLDFIAAISDSFEAGDYSGAIIRLLIIVEVLIGALGVASCVTVWGKGKADLVYRIIDVMGALFLFIALLLVVTTLL